jgi:hypothetical protein
MIDLLWIALALSATAITGFVAYWWGVGVAERRLIDDLDVTLELYQDAEAKARRYKDDLDALIVATGALTPAERAEFDLIVRPYLRGAA